MPKVTSENFSSFYDVRTGTQFSPMLDLRSGLYVGVAEVPAKVAKELDKRNGFRILSDQEYLAMTTRPEEPEAEEPSTGTSGSPLGHASTGQGGPPAPPSGPGSEVSTDGDGAGSEVETESSSDTSDMPPPPPGAEVGA